MWPPIHLSIVIINIIINIIFSISSSHLLPKMAFGDFWMELGCGMWVPGVPGLWVTCPACGISMPPTHWKGHVKSLTHSRHLEKRMRLHLAGLVGMSAHEWAMQDTYSVRKRRKLHLQHAPPLQEEQPMDEEVAP